MTSVWARPGASPKPDQAEIVATARKAESRFRLMMALQDMSPRQLHATLAGPPEQAAPWVATAARFGSAAGQLRFGQMLLDGLGVERDEAAALTWFLRAARGGAAEAMNMAGRCHENGWGTPIDLETAVLWYRRSAEAGHDWGEYNYANMVFDGRGVAQDHAEAVALYHRAADQGHARAMNLLARCCEEGWGTARDAAQAFLWFRRSAEGGYFRAQFNYGTLLVGLDRVDEALPWFDLACRAATPNSLQGMLTLLSGHTDTRLADLGRDLAQALLDETDGAR